LEGAILRSNTETFPKIWPPEIREIALHDQLGTKIF